MLPVSEWHQWAEGKPEVAFQFAYLDRQQNLNINHHRIKVGYNSLLLSLEGKIVMEVFSRQFNFFDYTMMQAFKHFSIAGAFKVYITD